MRPSVVAEGTTAPPKVHSSESLPRGGQQQPRASARTRPDAAVPALPRHSGLDRARPDHVHAMVQGLAAVADQDFGMPGKLRKRRNCPVENPFQRQHSIITPRCENARQRTRVPYMFTIHCAAPAVQACLGGPGRRPATKPHASPPYHDLRRLRQLHILPPSRDRECSCADLACISSLAPR